MATPDEARRALTLVTAKAVSDSVAVLTATLSTDDLLVAVPEIVGYYSVGSAALAADHYEDLRDEAGAVARFRAEPIIDERSEKIRRGILWASEPLQSFEPDSVAAAGRLAEVVQIETARPFRSTILANSERDPSSVGWRRISTDSCKFCRMLAANGAVYKQSTARFAAHTNCDCTAAPVFSDGDGPEASSIQYVASLRRKTPAQRQALRNYLAALPD